MPNHPTLRLLDFQPVIHQGETMWLLHDPLDLTPYQLVLPTALAQMLAFCDGSRSIADIQRDFSRHIGVQVNEAIVVDTLTQLDEACLLENARSNTARQNHLARYRAQSQRPPTFAGQGYPDEAHALRETLDGFGHHVSTAGPPWHGRGVISPHIDYDRGGAVYAQTWSLAAAAAREADLVIIFGTDHNGGQPITLTEVPYATPFGVLPTDKPLIERLAAAVGDDQAFAGELYHRQEHSIELSAVWLHHALGDASPPPMIPVLVGSFHHFLVNGSHPSRDPLLARFLNALRESTRGRRVLAVASVDLAHVGPQFGDAFNMDASRRRERATTDDALLAWIAAGDADRFYDAIAAVNDRDRICGFAPIYLLLRYLGETQGATVAYAQAAADAQDTSLVSFCGMLLT